jgi:N-acetylglucosamine malate deacetylase 1
MTKNILVVAAHSDDETLGCGGTLAKFSKAGHQIRVVFMTNGTGARGEDSEAAAERETDAKNALNALGVNNYINYGFPDNQLDQVALLTLAQVIEQEIEGFQPEMIISHHKGDLNIDHQKVAEAVLVASRPQPDFCVKEIWAFEVLSATDWSFSPNHIFSPNYFVDVTKFIETKINACSYYKDEFRDVPHSRSLVHVRTLAQHRGNSVGLDYAEAFLLIRKVQ